MKGRNKVGTNKQPAHTLQCDDIKATIWQNTGENGLFFSTTFSRPFKDQSGVLPRLILDRLLLVCDEAILDEDQ